MLKHSAKTIHVHRIEKNMDPSEEKDCKQPAPPIDGTTLLAEAAASRQPLQVNDPLSTLTAAAAAYMDNDDIVEETSPPAVDHGKSLPANNDAASRNAEDNEMVVSTPKEATETKLRGENVTLESKRQVEFPQKLFDMLQTEDVAIVSWLLPHGDGFIVRNNDRFISEILPKYCRHTKVRHWPNING